jgi:hypothetical protein
MEEITVLAMARLIRSRCLSPCRTQWFLPLQTVELDNFCDAYHHQNIIRHITSSITLPNANANANANVNVNTITQAGHCIMRFLFITAFGLISGVCADGLRLPPHQGGVVPGKQL